MLDSEFLTATNEKKVVTILDQACRNVSVGKSIKMLWQRRVGHQNKNIMTWLISTHLSLYAWCYMGQ